MGKLLGVEQLGQCVVVHIAYRHKIFLGLVLHHRGHKVGHIAGGAKKHLALAVLHVFLYVEGYSLRHTEVFHVFGYGDAEQLGQLEVVVDGMARGEHHSRVVEKTDLLLAEFLRRDAFHFNKGTKH